MCRWVACSGTPVLLSQVLFQPEHSLIDQSLHSRMGVETTKGDGFGIGWYPQDTEIFGPADDPPGAVARMAGPVETTAKTHGVPHPLQMTVAVTDGKHVWAFRYSREGRSRSLYLGTKVDALRAPDPDGSFLRELSGETRLVVSEPPGDLPGAWSEVPESSYGVVQPGGDVLHRFRPEYADGPGPRG
ncbi:hypothetical protein ABTZ21_22685 [Streptomyces sp. NPDC096191]|uniref:hypothetical protein n=1 Tax=Streptomyces sp. NPDC096191 TaxID=3155426 RepID=UPI003318B70A